MRAAVLGATGHVGSAIVRELVDRGWTVTAIGRRPRPTRNLDGVDVTYRSANGARRAELDEWCSSHDLLVDAAAPYCSYLGRQLDGRSSRTVVREADERMETIVSAAGRHGIRLAHVSSFSTLPPQRRDGFERIATEVTHRIHPYFAIKERMEKRVREAAGEGLKAVIVNPTLCLGPWDLKPAHLTWIPQVISGSLPAMIQHQVNVIDVRDVAAGLVTAVERERHGRPIPLTGHDIQLVSLAKLIAERAGVKPPQIHVPAAAAWAASLAGEVATGTLLPPALGVLLTCLYYDMYLGSDQRDFGLHPRHLSLTICDTIDWYRSIGSAPSS